VNITNYLVLGKTSPLTYQVLGHLKTVLILILGFTVFNVSIVIRSDACSYYASRCEGFVLSTDPIETQLMSFSFMENVCDAQKPVDFRNLVGIVIAMGG
jgi:hypothetical protein